MNLRPSLLLSAPLLAALLYVSARPVGSLPALGPLLDPAHGVWASARTAELPGSAEARVAGLTGEVDVRYDDRGVPHIFASNDEDLYRALGYVVARDRLFQLELQTRATAGTLTQLVGPAALEQDVRSRRLGLRWGADRRFASLDSSSRTMRVIRAYADGVNAYIAGMSAAERPLEYKVLGEEPMRWRPEYALYLLSRMSLTLAYADEEIRLARVRARVGREAAEALFPVNAAYQQPIQPNGGGLTIIPRTIPGPGAPDSTGLLSPRAVAMADMLAAPRSRDELSTGSNNWAVAPSRTSGRNAIIAGDPHLELTLPSIWYEVHLVVPGTLDVYGVTIPGSPSVIIGFNRDVAWSFTNTGADVLDMYAETVDDTLHPARYLLDARWRPVTRRVEEFLGRRAERIGLDTVYGTHRGPMRRVGGTWLSMHWTALDTNGTVGQLGAFDAANRARTVREFLDGTAAYPVPAQNMIVADRGGSIAIRSTGRFPVRPGDGRGTAVRDGSSSAADWSGNVPLAEYPQAIDPAQGWLASANQQPVDPRVNPRYFGADWAVPWRAIRINELLRADSAMTPEKVRRMQTDAGSARADALVPAMLAAGNAITADADSREAARLLGEWNRRYTRGDRRAVLFEAVAAQLANRLWDELESPDGGSARRRVATPSSEIVAELLADSASAWWDDRRTQRVERRDDILRAALAAALREVRTRYGDPADARWAWGQASPRNFRHLLRIPSFSETGRAADGGPSTISPRDDDGTHGASWRMVVEMSTPLRARVIYPGGQSGNPVSSRYLDRLPKWLAGELDEPLVPERPERLPPERLRSRLTLSPPR